MYSSPVRAGMVRPPSHNPMIGRVADVLCAVGHRQPTRIAIDQQPDAVGTHGHALLLQRRDTSCVEEITRQGIVRTRGVLARRVLLTRCGLAACDDAVAVTAGTQHGLRTMTLSFCRRPQHGTQRGKVQIGNTTLNFSTLQVCSLDHWRAT